MNINLSLSQKHMVNFLQNNKSGALFVSMREGKTASILYFLEQKQEKTLIVAPIATLKNVWIKQIEAHNVQLDYILYHSKKSSEKLFSKNILLINPESLQSLYSNYLEHYFQKKSKKNNLKHFPFKILIVDESTYFKNWNAKRTKILCKRLVPHIERRIILTGTPFHSGLEGIYAQQYIVDQGKVLGKTINEFRNTYMDKFVQQYQGKIFNIWRPKLGAENNILEKVKKSTLVIRNKLEDYLKYYCIEFEYEKKYQQLLEFYKKNKCFPTIIYKTYNNLSILETVSSTFIQLSELTNGFIYNRDEALVFDESRLKIASELLNKTSKRYLIAIKYRYERLELAKLIKNHSVYETEKSLEGVIQEGGHIITHPRSLSHGVDLSGIFDGIFWYSLPTSYEVFSQFNARLLNKRLQNDVPIYVLQAKKTLDNHIWYLLNQKTNNIKQYYSYLQNND